MKSNVGAKNSMGSYNSGRSDGIHSNPDLQYAYNQAMNNYGYNPNRNSYDPGFDNYMAPNYPSILNGYSYGGYQPPGYNSNDLAKGYLHPNYNFNNNNPLYGGGGYDLPSNRFVDDVESYGNFNSQSYDNMNRMGRGKYNQRNFNDFNDNLASLNLDGAPRRGQPKKLNNQISGLNAKDARTRVY